MVVNAVYTAVGLLHFCCELSSCWCSAAALDEIVYADGSTYLPASGLNECTSLSGGLKAVIETPGRLSLEASEIDPSTILAR